MKKEPLVTYTIRIKQENVPYNYGGSNYTLRAEKQKEAAENFRRDFAKVLNAVVDLGGVFCLDKYTLDSDYRMYTPTVKIKLPKENAEKIKNLPYIESFCLG